MRAVSKTLVASAAATAIALSLGASAVSAKTFKLTAGSSHPPIVPWVAMIKNHVVPESMARVKAAGKGDTIQWTQAYAGALYNFKNTLEGVQNGLADLGWVGTLWEPIKMPLMNVSFYAPFVTGDVKVLTSIGQQLHKDVPAMNKAWDKHNQVYLGIQVADTYNLFTKFPVKSVADLNGKKLYAPDALAGWVRGTGAVAVNGGLPVYYNGVKTGVADGGITITTGMFPFKLHEVGKYITVVDMGGPISGAITMNKDTWNSLPAYMQDIFMKLGGEYSAKQAAIIEKNAVKFMGLMAKQGAIVSTLPAAERRKWAEVMPNIAKEWVDANEKKGIPAKAVMKTFMDVARASGAKPLRNWDEGL
ncbi:MAG: C4-dicarboxylate TRAP transporter substrate-binding protein [Alphaproteobacteria bacterium]